MTPGKDDPAPQGRQRHIVPALVLPNQVLFPGTIIPITVRTERQLEALEAALQTDRSLVVVASRPHEPDNPYELGTLGTVVRLLRLPAGESQILLQGLTPARILDWVGSGDALRARVEEVADSDEVPQSVSVRALCGTLKSNLHRLAELSRPVSAEVLELAHEVEDPVRLAHLAVSNLDLEVSAAQQVLEASDPVDKLQLASRLLGAEVKLAETELEIHDRTRDEFDRSHRENFLRRQMREIQEELADGDWIGAEIDAYRGKMAGRRPPSEVDEEFERQLQRLERAHPESVETSILRNHLDALVAVPWGVSAEERTDLAHAEEVLDRHHYGLEEAKLRLLEFLAVRRLNPDAKGPILCLLGPPGVGKTSLGRAVAEATGRTFVQAALGGVHDEAEIRGHRRTYVGAMPGRIVHGLIQAGFDNPVFVLDEIDKLGSDFRGDPTSALLEVLDPEQNSTFRDHFLGVGVDLSRVLFLATANQVDTIPPALRDRLEILPLSGYSPIEKMEIARRHLLPRQTDAAGIKRGQARLTDAALRTIIREYTHEAGVRQLERGLAKICRKVALATVKGEKTPGSLGVDRVREFLGPPVHGSEEILDAARVGVTTGLAWTPSGGDLLIIEATAVPNPGGNRGEMRLTGSLGDVMRESAQAALSHVRSVERADDAVAFFADNDIHVHVPAGAVPKDGPSAGITMATAIASLVRNQPVNHRLAMTGELTLRGEVLAVGGIREKLLAAHGAGISRLILPRRNQVDVEALHEAWVEDLEIHYVDSMHDVLSLALKA